MRCKTCHYSLEGLTGPSYRCPECGRAFDPDNVRTFDVPLPMLVRNVPRTLGLALLCAILLAALFIVYLL